jgi:hypothetical protein
MDGEVDNVARSQQERFLAAEIDESSAANVKGKITAVRLSEAGERHPNGGRGQRCT